MNTNKSVVKSANMEDKNITAFYAVEGICPHGKRKSRCLPCGGVEICEHNMLKVGV
jgi:hypothetical protein